MMIYKNKKSFQAKTYRTLTAITTACAFSACGNIHLNQASEQSTTLFYYEQKPLNEAAVTDSESRPNDYARVLQESVVVVEEDLVEEDLVKEDLVEETLAEETAANIGQVEIPEEISINQHTKAQDTGSSTNTEPTQFVAETRQDASTTRLSHADEEKPPRAWFSSLFNSSQSNSMDTGILQDSYEAPEESLQQADNNSAIESVISETDEQAIAVIKQLNEELPTASGMPADLHLSANESKLRDELSIIHHDASRTETPILLSQQIKRLLDKTRTETLDWHLKIDTSQNKQQACRLSTPSIQLDKAGYSTQVWLDITDNSLYLNSTLTLDPSLLYNGFQLESGEFIKLSLSKPAHYAHWQGNLSTLLHENNKLSFIIGGQDINSEYQFISINLKNLKQQFPKFLDCEKRVALQNKQQTQLLSASMH